MPRCLYLLALPALGACAPVYRPPAPFVPLPEAQGDANVAVQTGTGGVQADASYAATDLVAARVGLQATPFDDRGRYALGRLGAEFYGADDDGLRYGVALEGGMGLTRGVGDVVGGGDDATTTTTTTTDVDLLDIGEVQNSGTLVAAAVRPSIGFEGGTASTALILGFGYHVVNHDADSDKSGASHGLTFEPTAWVRIGGARTPIGFQTWLGVAWLLAGTGGENVPVPINLGFGATVDLPRWPSDRGGSR